MPKGIKIFYSEEMLDWIKNNVKDCPHRILTEKFNKKFNTEYSIDCLRNLCQRKGWHNGFTGCFEKGHVPDNKGKKMPLEIYKKLKETMFSKGNIPENHRPVGSERLQADGYMYVKVAEHNKWRMKHHIEWEKYNTPIKQGEILYFLDGNKTNCSIDNLMLTKKEYIGAINRIVNKNKPSKTAVLVASLQVETKKARLKIRKKRPNRSDKYDVIKRLLDSRFRTFEIAKELNITENMVGYYRRRIKIDEKN